MSHHPRFSKRTINVLSVKKRTPVRARGSYGRFTAKQRAQIGRYALDWEQRNCHAAYSSPAHTRGSTPLPCSTRGSPSLPRSGKSDSFWRKNCTGKSQPCRSLDLKFCKLSALPLASSCGCESRKIESAKILLNRNLEDFAKMTTPMVLVYSNISLWYMSVMHCNY